ncbi:glycosyltransferase family 2 protein [Paenibacillus planticolens]|uniref:Glycosyltransferase n=1 Tax=Paenibacillus planticolens TaxID=2654976 RepID=A0ABX1ZQW9_9BACL|nr:glycosyltransferase family 2 protein [Paenibacillus planticolens]NOV02083.1 glycosyltransferase [Paenibacillus planticolens]
MTPLVSILLPTYERPQYLEQALLSALNQTYSHIEIIICDNSRDDTTEQVVQSYLPPHSGFNIKYVRNETNIGPIANQHKCFKLASGEYVNYLMDDDLFHPRKIELMVPYLIEDPQIGLVTSRKQIIDDLGEPVRIFPDPPFPLSTKKKTAINGQTVIKSMLTDTKNYIGEPTAVLFRKSDLVEPFGTFGGKQAFNNVDVASWIAVLANKHAVFLKEPLCSFRKHPTQLTNTLLSRMGCQCDWIDATLLARQQDLLKDSSTFAEIVSRLGKTVLNNFLKWNDATYHLYVDELLMRVRQLIYACEKNKKLSKLAKDLKKLAEQLETRKLIKLFSW